MKKILKDKLLLFFGGLMLILLFFQPVAFSAIPDLVHWPTLTALSALLLTTAGIKASGMLERWAGRFTHLLATERSIALCLVLFSAASAMILTNDIALFLVIPFTLQLHEKMPLNIRPLLVLETIAVNTGSMLTPIGNPQNIYLWQHTQVPFFSFIQTMVPPALIQLSLLVIFALFIFDTKPLKAAPALLKLRVDYKLAAISFFLLIGYLVGDYFGIGLYVLVAICIFFLVAFRPVFLSADWALIILFLLLFIDMGMMARLPFLRRIIENIPGHDPVYVVARGAGFSQLISNVPATLLLSHYTVQWKYLAWGVNIGGNGLLIASFANLIAVRLAGRHNIAGLYHRYSIPYLLLSILFVWSWLMIF